MNLDFLFDLGVTAVLSTLKTVIKSERSKAQYEKVMLKIYNSIGNAYPEFKEN